MPSAHDNLPKSESTVRDSAVFDAKDGLRLFHRWVIPANPKAVVAVVHGYGDHSGRYVHVLEHLAQAGFAAHALDYRGHGQAGGKRGAVGTFQDYLDDLGLFLQRVADRSPDLELFLLGHSHGGLMSAVYCSGERAESLPKAKGLVLSGPYFRLRIEPSSFQKFLTQSVGKILPNLAVKNPLNETMLTHDEAMQDATRNDPLYHRAVTPGWFSASNGAQVQAMAEAAKLQIPLLVLQGAEDPVAHPEGASAYVDAAGTSDKTLKSYAGMLHEPFNEVGREEVLNDLVDWLSAHL